MTVSLTQARLDTKRALRDRIDTALGPDPSRTVAIGWPRDIPLEVVVVLDTSGTIELSHIMAGRKDRLDTFTVDVFCGATAPGQQSAEDAEQRVSTLLAAVENVLANDPTLGGLVKSASIGEIDGPNSEPGDEGWLGFALAHVACKAEYS